MTTNSIDLLDLNRRVVAESLLKMSAKTIEILTKIYVYCHDAFALGLVRLGLIRLGLARFC